LPAKRDLSENLRRGSGFVHERQTQHSIAMRDRRLLLAKLSLRAHFGPHQQRFVRMLVAFGNLAGGLVRLARFDHLPPDSSRGEGRGRPDDAKI
jgi:hypothetical protein